MEMERVKDMLCSEGKAVLFSSDLAGLGLHVVAPWLQQGCGTSVSSFCDQLGGTRSYRTSGTPLGPELNHRLFRSPLTVPLQFKPSQNPKTGRRAGGLRRWAAAMGA